MQYVARPKLQLCCADVRLAKFAGLVVSAWTTMLGLNFGVAMFYSITTAVLIDGMSSALDIMPFEAWRLGFITIGMFLVFTGMLWIGIVIHSYVSRGVRTVSLRLRSTNTQRDMMAYFMAIISVAGGITVNWNVIPITASNMVAVLLWEVAFAVANAMLVLLCAFAYIGGTPPDPEKTIT